MKASTTQRVAILAPRSTIARAVAERLVQAGGELALVGRDLSGLDTDTAGFAAECDLTGFAAVEAALSEANEALGGLTGLVNCAGSLLLKPAHLTSRQDFDATLEANLATSFAAVRAAARQLSDSGGSVVLVSSAAASFGMPNHEAIAAAKGAVEALVRSAAATYATKAIRFNAVAPGLVATHLSEKLVSNETSRKVSESLHALGRAGAPEEVASAICWLLDPQQSWVTGQVIGVDGGLSRVQPRAKAGASRR